MTTETRATVDSLDPASAFVTLNRHRWLLYVVVIAVVLALSGFDRRSSPAPKDAALGSASAISLAADPREALLLPTN